MSVGPDVVNDSGAADVAPDTGSDSTDPRQAQEDIDSWANEDVRVSKPRDNTGRFKRSTDADAKEVQQTLKQTVKNATRRPVRPTETQEAEEGEQPEPQEEPERPKARRQVKGIVNGREELIDLDDEEFQRVNAVQATRAAQKAWREAAEMRKQAQEFQRNLELAKAKVSENPMELFKALGIPEEQVFQFAQQQTINKLAETINPHTGEPYTPEQQRIIQLQKELEAKQAAEQQQRMTQEQQEFEQLKDVMRQDLDRKFTAALQNTGLPPTPYTMMRLADMMQHAGPDVDPQQLAPLVLEDMVNEVRHTIYSMPMEVALEVLGEEFVNELRKYDIGKARQSREKFGRNPQHLSRNSEQRVQNRNARPGASMNTTEAQDWLDKWANGGR